MNFVFLYTRFSDYFYKSLQSLLNANSDIIAHVVRYKQDKNAPFVFKETNNLKLYSYDDFESKERLLLFVKRLNPSLIYSAGWSNKYYRFISSNFYAKCPTIIGLDNPWKASIKQLFGVVFFRIFMKSTYSHIWVAGKPQYKFARHLGFKHKTILNDLYTANTEIFNEYFNQNMEKKSISYPKKLIFIGRYVSYKQPLLLAKSFKELEDEGLTNGWILEFIGSGPKREDLLKFQSGSININNFIKPEELPSKLSSAGAFCMPSKCEHWGVVVHEAAAAGLPLLLSNTTYAGTHFLVEGINGYSFDENNYKDLKNKLKLFFGKKNKELNVMSHASNQLSKVINHKTWTTNLLSVLN